MNKKTIRLVLVGCGITLFLGISFAQLLLISNLSEQIKKLEERVNNLPYEFPSTYPTTSTVVNNQEYLLEDWEDEYKNINTENHTVDYYLKVMPKTIKEDMKVSLLYKDTTYEMTPNGNYYEATIPLYLFDVSNDSEPAYIIIENDGEKKFHRHSQLDRGSLYYNFLPYLSVNSNSTSSSIVGKQLTVNYNYRITIERNWFQSSRPVDFTKIDLVTILNGAEIEREDITKEVKENHDEAAVFGGTKDKKTFKEFDGNDYVHMYFEAIDEYGYTHKQTLIFVSANRDRDNYQSYNNIYDKEGNELIKYE